MIDKHLFERDRDRERESDFNYEKYNERKT